MRTLPSIAGVAVLVVTMGCGSPSSDSGSSPSTKASDSGGRSASTQGSAASSATPRPAAGTLTGYGALREDWNASHNQAPGMTPGAAFLPMVNGDQPKYAAVSGESGERILSYEIYFEDGTSLETAKRMVLQEFPAGAKFGVEDKDEAHCLIVDIISAPVERVMDGYRPIVGFFSKSEVSEVLDKSQVHNASMLIAGPDEKTDLGMC